MMSLEVLPLLVSVLAPSQYAETIGARPTQSIAVTKIAVTRIAGTHRHRANQPRADIAPSIPVSPLSPAISLPWHIPSSPCSLSVSSLCPVFVQPRGQVSVGLVELKPVLSWSYLLCKRASEWDNETTLNCIHDSGEESETEMLEGNTETKIKQTNQKKTTKPPYYSLDAHAKVLWACHTTISTVISTAYV